MTVNPNRTQPRSCLPALPCSRSGRRRAAPAAGNRLQPAFFLSSATSLIHLDRGHVGGSPPHLEVSPGLLPPQACLSPSSGHPPTSPEPPEEAAASPVSPDPSQAELRLRDLGPHFPYGQAPVDPATSSNPARASPAVPARRRPPPRSPAAARVLCGPTLEPRHSRAPPLPSEVYADLEFQVGDHVFLNRYAVLGWRSCVSESLAVQRYMQIWSAWKFSPRFVDPFEVLEQVGLVAYRIALPPRLAGIHNIFHVSVLRKYVFDPSHMVDFTQLELGEDLRYVERPVRILARETKEFRNRMIPYLKVQWSHHEEREATCEPETVMREFYPYLFETKV
uniref:Tf2-1-like SH3-like domain-containing protein n=1 Tax=Ananas comosus var. bracteatus TaxID=296719 RepID=A0A6V7NWR7_ANACO|nr:unnamed protein product [Ananas comosus var. bracteatus]